MFLFFLLLIIKSLSIWQSIERLDIYKEKERERKRERKKENFQINYHCNFHKSLRCYLPFLFVTFLLL